MANIKIIRQKYSSEKQKNYEVRALNTLEKNAKSTSNIKIVIHYSENNGAKLAFLKKNWFTVNSGHLIKEVIN